MTDTLVLSGFATVVTNDGKDLLGRAPGGVVVVRGASIAWVGPSERLPSEYTDARTERHEGATLMPGFVDAHTHLVWAGERSGEFDARMRGRTYEEILASGGGILSTVASTRAASFSELYEGARRRLRRMVDRGTTTVEIKSGYGLDIDTEHRMLEVADRLGREEEPTVISTFLGAHVVAPEYADDREAYVRLVEGPMLERCAPLAGFCDVFCEEGVFTVDESRRILEAGLRRGLRPRLHADQLGSSGGAELAAEVGAVSADHLEHVDDEGIAALASAGVVAVVLPTASLSLRSTPAPVRRLIDAGVQVAVATDCNPGTSNVLSMPFVVAMSVLHAGMTPDEAVWGATRGGALALGLEDRGVVREGARADLVVLDAPDPVHLAYRPDADLVSAVYVGGRRVG